MSSVICDSDLTKILQTSNTKGKNKKLYSKKGWEEARAKKSHTFQFIRLFLFF